MLAVCLVAVLLCGAGLLRLHVETDPQRLWVGARSQALAEKRHFEVRRRRRCSSHAGLCGMVGQDLCRESGRHA